MLLSELRRFHLAFFNFNLDILINSEVVPPAKKGESFRYLGRCFNFDMDSKDHKEQKYLLHLHPRNKRLIYDLYTLSKISWHLTVADLGKTWISI